jgi:hypothetical protein
MLRPNHVGILSAAAAVLLLAVVAALLKPSRQVRATELEVRFVGFTNRPTGSAALFLFTNGTPRAVHVQTTALEAEIGGEWETVRTSPTNRLVGSFSAGKTFIWPLDIETTNKAWRLQVSCVEEAKGLARLLEATSELFYRIRTGTATSTFTGRSYSVTSR